MISIIQGDVIEVLKDYPDESFTACFCDPPYGLKFMGKEWDHGVPATPYWAEILRVLKPGAVLMAFSGTRTWHRLGVAIEDAGFELFDTMMWLHAQGFPKSHNIGKAIDKAAGAEREVVGPATRHSGQSYQWAGEIRHPTHSEEKAAITAPATDAAKTWEGYGTSLKPSFEPILLARKPRNATYAQTAMEHGTAALNIDGCRIPSAKPYTINTWDDGAKPFGDGAGHPFTGRQQSGRWPANLILSHSSECGDEGCVEDCPVVILNRQSGVSKSVASFRGAGGGGDKIQQLNARLNSFRGYTDTGGASRFFKTFEGERFCYVSKANRRERGAGLPEGEHSRHPTVKPLALCKYLAHLIVPPEEYRDEAELLVPFSGVKSEVLGAFLAGWRNITAIELEKEYCEIGQKRIDWWLAKIKETGLTDPKAILKKGI